MSNLVTIDNKINELLSRAKLAIFGVLDKTSNIKQLLVIDDEMTKLIIHLDELPIIGERKFRIMRIQSMQDIIDFIIKNKDKFNNDLLKDVQLELNLLSEQNNKQNEKINLLLKLNNNQKEKINLLFEQNNLLSEENDNLKIENEHLSKNIGTKLPEKIDNDIILNTKINLLLEKNDILKNENINMSKNIAYQLSKLNDTIILNEKTSDLLRVEQLKNATLNDGIRNKNIQIEELKNKPSIFGNNDLLKKEQLKNAKLNDIILNKNIQIEKLNNLVNELNKKIDQPSFYDSIFGK